MTRVILAILTYEGFTLAINGVAAPWIRGDFGLDDSGLARLFALVSISAVGAFGLARAADRLGRRPILLACLAVTPLSAAGAAVATGVWRFAALEVVMLSCSGAAIATSVVLLAEQSAAEGRASGQGLGGAAIGAGSGACIVAMPVLLASGLTWRWLLWLSAAGLLAWPLLAARLAESRAWTPSAHAPAGGPFARAYLRRSLAILASGFMSTLVVTTGNAWRYFHAVSVVGLSPALASGVLLLASGAGLGGFALGARAADRVGRVPTVAGAAVLMTAGLAWSYWGPPAGGVGGALWLGAGFLLFTGAANAMTVGGNCSATELFPTEVRGALMGWLLLVGAVAQLCAQGAVALLAGPLGGISVVVGALGGLGLGVAIVYLGFVPETRGTELGGAPPAGAWPTLLTPPE